MSDRPTTHRLKLLLGGGQKQPEPLQSRDAVVRVLLEAGVDLMLKRISSERAEDIEHRVEQILTLFDAVDLRPQLMGRLEAELDALEGVMRETRPKAVRRAT